MRTWNMLSAVAIAAFGPTPNAPASDQLPDCRHDTQLQLLDFWIGRWTVQVDGRTVGQNRIEKALDGCAVIEHWQPNGGGRGMSLFYLAPNRRELKQVWVTSAALSPGGTKEKSLVTRAEDGTLVFEGVWWTSDGAEMLDRTRLTPLPDGRVRQVIEVSADAGQHWTTNFDAVYSRASTPSKD